MDVLRKELCALKFRKMNAKFENISKILFCRFLFIRMKRNAHITSILVYCSVKSLFCFKLDILNVHEVQQ